VVSADSRIETALFIEIEGFSRRNRWNGLSNIVKCAIVAKCLDADRKPKKLVDAHSM